MSQNKDGVPFMTGSEGQHFFVFGHTGKGKSNYLKAEAQRRGISYEELLKSLEPTEEQKEAAAKQKQIKEEQEAQRLSAIRTAYWQFSSEKDFPRLYDALVSSIAPGVTPTADQLKALFMMLPAQIIGLGVAWGFDDSEVGVDIYHFIANNKQEVEARLGLEIFTE